MDKVDKYIDNMFHQKFSGAGDIFPPTGGEWLQLSKVIRRKNFLRFSSGSFNVYYLTAIVATITTIGSFVLPNILGSQKNGNINQPSAIQLVDTLPKADSLHETADSTLIMKLETQNSNCSDKKSAIKLIKEDPKNVNSLQSMEEAKDVVNSEITSLPSDSLSKPIKISCSGDEEMLSRPEVNLADTIVKIDTIRIQKKTVQFKRKKEGF